MNPRNNSNEFEQYIIQQLSQLDEVPSEKVWENLESKWAKDRKYPVSAIVILWMFPVITIAGVIFLLQHTTSYKEVVAFTGEASSICDEPEVYPGKLNFSAANAPIQDQQIAQSQGLYPRKWDSPNHALTTTALPTTAHESEPVFSEAHSETGSGTDAEAFVYQENTSPFTQKTDSTQTPVVEKKKSIKKRKQGNDWDYQLGVRLGTANFYSQIMRPSNPFTDILHIEGIGEWAISHRLRVNSGVIWQGIGFDFDQENTSPTYILSTAQALGVQIDTQQVESVRIRGVENQLLIPLDFLIFITPQDPNTQFWVGVGLRQQVWKRNMEAYSFQMVNGNILVERRSQEEVSFNYRDFRFMVGAEQRLTTALRLRANGFIIVRKSHVLLNSFYHQYGGSVSLFWASPRGPLRWRKNTKPRY